MQIHLTLSQHCQCLELITHTNQNLSQSQLLSLLILICFSKLSSKQKILPTPTKQILFGFSRTVRAFVTSPLGAKSTRFQSHSFLFYETFSADHLQNKLIFTVGNELIILSFRTFWVSDSPKHLDKVLQSLFSDKETKS